MDNEIKKVIQKVFIFEEGLRKEGPPTSLAREEVKGLIVPTVDTYDEGLKQQSSMPRGRNR